MTDGVMPESAVPSLMPGLANRSRGAAVMALLKTGAWERRAGGYLVHAFLEYQDSAETVRRQREAGKARARRSRVSRGTFTARSPERHAARSPDVRDAVDSAVESKATTTPLPPLVAPYQRIGKWKQDAKTTIEQHGGDVLINIEE
jgi:hypothetical protein